MTRYRKRPAAAALFLAALVAGCGELTYSLPTPATEPPPDGTRSFDPNKAGTVAGTVRWDGPMPAVEPYQLPKATPLGIVSDSIPNPNAPVVDAVTRAVAGAAVFLRGIVPAAARPWDWPPVRVAWQDKRIGVLQDGGLRRVGFVRRGDPVEFMTTEPGYHAIRSRGAGFFTLPFPEPNRPLSRTFDRPGRVELSSAAGAFWAAADLFVSDHPYFALSAGDGSFTLPKVPAGEYEIVCWLPNWHVVGQERDPETGFTVRQSYAPPVEVARRVRVEPGRTVDITFTVAAEMFDPKP